MSALEESVMNTLGFGIGGRNTNKEKRVKKEQEPVKKNCIAQKSHVLRNMPKPAKKVVLADKTAVKKTKDGITNITLVRALIGYTNKESAKADSEQFVHPGVFSYRSALFPNPVNYNVVVKVTHAKPVEIDPRSLKPYAISLTITISGAENKVKSWVARFDDRIKAYMIL